MSQSDKIKQKKKKVLELSEILLGQQKDAIQTLSAKPCLLYGTNRARTLVGVEFHCMAAAILEFRMEGRKKEKAE